MATEPGAQSQEKPGYLIRAAHPGDENGIACVKQSTWPAERLRIERIQDVLRSPEHACLVAEWQGKIMGFVDGFLTRDSCGERRWEVDLLAVEPCRRGSGLGKTLVQASVSSGFERQASLCRALIQVDNIASQRTFHNCGFEVDPQVCDLFILHSTSKHKIISASLPHGFLAVHTLNYRGLWIENSFSPAGFDKVRVIVAEGFYDLAGVVIPRSMQPAGQAALEADFVCTGAYQLWKRYKDH